MLIKIILLITATYLLGSIPFGYIITKLASKKDIRDFGSGNVGATNVFRTVGKFYGVCTLILDALKGYAAVEICYYLFSRNGVFAIIAAVSVILGHGYSIFLKGKGGKCVATTLGIFIALAFPAVFFAFVIFVAFVGLFGYISIGSIAASIFLPIALATLKYDKSIIIFSIVLSLYIIYKHIPNILRIIKGTENKFIKSF